MPANCDRWIGLGRPRGSKPGGRTPWFTASLLMIFGPALYSAAELHPETLAAWNHYIEQAKSQMTSRLDPGSHFLWLDEVSARACRVRSGEILVAPVNGCGRTEVPNGLIHDWIGAAFFPDTTVEKVFSTVGDYGCYKEFYAPTVIDARLLARDGRESSFSMRWLKKALFKTIVMEGDYKACYIRRNEKSRYGFVWSTRIQEVVNNGHMSELKLAPERGSGFIWRLFSISRFEERDGGVYVELEAMALSRCVPAGLGWLVNPVVHRLSQSALITSLGQTREAVKSLPQRAGLESCGSKRAR